MKTSVREVFDNATIGMAETRSEKIIGNVIQETFDEVGRCYSTSDHMVLDQMIPDNLKRPDDPLVPTTGS